MKVSHEFEQQSKQQKNEEKQKNETNEKQKLNLNLKENKDTEVESTKASIFCDMCSKSFKNHSLLYGHKKIVHEDNEVKIIVDNKSFLYLIGTTLEFSGGLNGKGFVFNNPNASRTCGCGESFSL